MSFNLFFYLQMKLLQLTGKTKNCFRSDWHLNVYGSISTQIISNFFLFTKDKLEDLIKGREETFLFRSTFFFLYFLFMHLTNEKLRKKEENLKPFSIRLKSSSNESYCLSKEIWQSAAYKQSVHVSSYKEQNISSTHICLWATERHSSTKQT